MAKNNKLKIICITLAAILVVCTAAVSSVLIKKKTTESETTEIVSVFEEEAISKQTTEPEEEPTEEDTEEITTKEMTTVSQTTRVYSTTAHKSRTTTTKAPITTKPTTTKSPSTTVPTTKAPTTTKPTTTEVPKPKHPVTLKTDAKGQEVIKYFGDVGSYKKILDDVSEIDFYFKPDFNNKKYKIKKITEDVWSKYEYYDGDKLIYTDYSGYGEDYFEYHTKTKSGKAAVVGYENQQGERFSARIKTSKYEVDFSFIDKSAPLGAQEVYIEAIKKNANDLNETLTYWVSDKTVLVYEAYYYTSDTYVQYSSWQENGKVKSLQSVLFSKCTKETSKNIIDDIRSEELYLACQTVVGNHKLSFKGSGENKKWFMTMKLYLPFSDEEEARAYAQRHSLGDKAVSQNYVLDDNMWIVEYKDVTLPIAKDAKLFGRSFKDFAVMEFNDNSFADIEINENYEITKLTMNNSVLSYY